MNNRFNSVIFDVEIAPYLSESSIIDPLDSLCYPGQCFCKLNQTPCQFENFKYSLRKKTDVLSGVQGGQATSGHMTV